MNFRHLTIILSVLCIRALAAPAQDELICHTSDVTECYPRIFRPTNEFQVVRDDQHIPKGLHVRLNFQTGLKEAKLYDPSKDTDVVNAVEVVPEDAGQEEPYHRPTHDDHAQIILEGMKQASYGESGSIKPPPASGGDGKTFQDNTQKIREYLKDHDNNNEDAARAFSDLDELCHDIYWGLQLIKDTPTLSALYDAITYEGSHANPWDKWAKSASLLGTALQNNKAALTVFHGFVESREASKRQHQHQHQSFIDTVAKGLSIGPVNAKVHTTYLISKLLQNDGFLADFLVGQGLHSLNNGLGQIQQAGSGGDAGGSDHDKLNFKKKAANLVGDYVLVVDEARERLTSLHDPIDQGKKNSAAGSTPGSMPLPTKLVAALADRKAWCEVFDVAFGIWRFGVNGNKKMPAEKERWSYVPASCNPSVYDVATGEMLPAAKASLEREL